MSLEALSSAHRGALPPGPRNALLQTARYFRDPYAYTAEMTERYGEVFTMPATNGLLVITSSAEGHKQVLAGREADFVMGFGVDAVAPIIGEGSMLLISGDRHRRERKLAAPPFHGRRMKAHSELMRRVAWNEVARWQAGQEIVIGDTMRSVSLEVILRVIFGVQSSERVAAFENAIQESVGSINPALVFFRFLQHELGGFGPWAHFLRKLRALDELLYAEIEAARRDGDQREDVLARLAEARFDDGSLIPDRALRDQLLTLVFAGHETTATTLSWAIYEITRHPEVEARLRDELAPLGNEPGAEELAALPYLEAVCQETLRMHPVLAEYFRTVKTSFPLLGYQIPAGVTLAPSIIQLHQDPELYPEPAKFEPARFLERRFAPYEFASFGGGHRRCLGAAFAMQELKIVLGTVLSQVSLELAQPGSLKTVRRNGTLAPEKGVPIRVARRISPAPARAA